jgi:hypothetical protein
VVDLSILVDANALLLLPPLLLVVVVADMLGVDGSSSSYSLRYKSAARIGTLASASDVAAIPLRDCGLLWREREQDVRDVDVR